VASTVRVPRLIVSVTSMMVSVGVVSVYRIVIVGATTCADSSVRVGCGLLLFDGEETVEADAAVVDAGTVLIVAVTFVLATTWVVAYETLSPARVPEFNAIAVQVEVD
jgi:hypothetical protein